MYRLLENIKSSLISVCCVLVEVVNKALSVLREYKNYFNLNTLNVLLILLIAVDLFTMYWPVLQNVAAICWNDDDHSHGLLLPFISLYLLWEKRDEIANAISESEVSKSYANYLLGVFLLLLGGFIFLLGVASKLLFPQWFSLFVVGLGCCMLIFTRRLGLLVFLPFALNYMALPIPRSVIPKLFNPFQVFAAKVSAMTLELLQVPVYLRGNIIEIPGMLLLVEEACSGIRSLISIVTVAMIVCYLVKVPVYMKALLLLFSVFVAVALNVVRVSLTGVLAHFFSPDLATGFFHEFSGLVIFVIGLFIIYGVARLFLRRVRI